MSTCPDLNELQCQQTSFSKNWKLHFVWFWSGEHRVTNPGLGGKTQMSWDTQCFIDKYLIICPLKHRQPVQWCNELHCRRLEDFEHQLNDKWPDSLKVRKESFFKKKQKTTCIHIQEDRKKNVTWNRVKLICIARFGLQLTGSLKYHLPSSSWLQIWALPFYI